MYNPSLREEPREQLAQVIPLQQETSLLNWLEASGRLIPRDNTEVDFPDAEEEISELMGADDVDYDDDDDDEPLEDDA
ncbi:MAG TPA: hypothetical protein DEG17_05350 [Cyanobacteria bacterium UBA11149]|nr:hypothetical protein [Cyanobacteria bacterium UBA11366]HBR75594.1 hypothetical protein [Cyanobacteria bacterium UBA11159]HBW88308.1 hypothetical protein [Cyanobacteria bacterium UBA11149]HCA94464.1 hypothetical protein [Cyanobacteria bacterium UBA9226]